MKWLNEFAFILFIITIAINLINSLANLENYSNSSILEENKYIDQLNEEEIIEEINRIFDGKDLYHLKRELLSYSDTDTRPIYDSSKPINVGLSVGIIQINDLDPLYQVNCIFSELKMNKSAFYTH